MPRYYFDVNDGTEHRDEVGVVFDDNVTARNEALKLAAFLSKTVADEGKEPVLSVSARTETGAVALRVRMACQVDELRQDLPRVE